MPWKKVRGTPDEYSYSHRRITIRMEDELFEAVAEAAFNKNLSCSEYCRNVLYDHIMPNGYADKHVLRRKGK